MISVLGAIYIDDKEIEGYHVNSTFEIEGAEGYMIETPTDYKNSFFGVPVEKTYFYKFADEAECKLILEIEEELPDE